MDEDERFEDCMYLYLEEYGRGDRERIVIEEETV